MYLAYLGVTLPLLRMRLDGWPGNLPDARDGCSRSARGASSVNLLAIVYGGGMTINLLWPRIEFYVDDTYRWGPIGGTVVLVGFGLIYYYAVQQHKGGVLEEHRAEATAGD